MLTIVLGALLGILLAYWLEQRQMRREWWESRGRPMLDRYAREDAEDARRRQEEEARRTWWRSEDGGWGYKYTENPFRELKRPDQPWNYRRMWQGIVHSSARLALAQRNAEIEAERQESRARHRALLAARPPQGE